MTFFLQFGVEKPERSTFSCEGRYKKSSEEV